MAAVGCQQQAPDTGYAYANEGRPYANELLRAVSREWKADWLVKMADPRMLAVAPESKIHEMMDAVANAYGPARRQEMLAMNVGVETDIAGTTATYLFRLDCEKKAARVVIKMQKSEGHWKALGFRVEPMPSAK